MRFRFYGGLDCPDWILAQIAGFTDVPTEVFKEWCEKVLTRLMTNSTNFTEFDLESLKVLADARRIKGFISALSFILEKASKNECSAGDLEKEMLQLGMSTEHAAELSEVYSRYCSDLHDYLVRQFPREPSLTLIDASPQELGAGVVVDRLLVKTSEGRKMQLAVERTELQSMKEHLRTALETLEKLDE